MMARAFRRKFVTIRSVFKSDSSRAMPVISLLAAMAFFLAPQVLLSQASADDAMHWKIGASLIGSPKYKSGFTRFDYVNPDAP